MIVERGREIWWTHDNHVRNFFRDTWRGYLAQQRALSWASVLSVFRFPKMLLTKDLYSGEPIVPQLAVMLLMLLSPVGLLLCGWEGLWAMLLVLAGGLLFFALCHLRFFRYLGPQGMASYGRHRVFCWMVVTRIVWVYGVAQGIWDGIRMRWSHWRWGRSLIGGEGP